MHSRVIFQKLKEDIYNSESIHNDSMFGGET